MLIVTLPAAALLPLSSFQPFRLVHSLTGTGPTPPTSGSAQRSSPGTPSDATPPGVAAGASSPGWTDVNWFQPPPAMTAASAAYDTSDQELVRFGGLNANNVLTNETWTFSGGQWTNVTATAGSAPPPTAYGSMVYDAKDGYILEWGGQCYFGPPPFPSCNATWTFHNGRWAMLSTLHTPPGESLGISLTYDAADGYVLLYDGDANETWTFVGGAWTQLGTGGGTYLQPGYLRYSTLAYDPADGYSVLFGGQNTGATSCPSTDLVCNTTWKFLGGSWTLLSPSVSPPARYRAAMTYDAAAGVVLLFGGAYFANGSTSRYATALNDTWVYTGGSWTLDAGANYPQAREAEAMAFDAADNVTVLFGGSYELPSTLAITLSDTWEWGSLSSLPSPLNATLVSSSLGGDAGMVASLGALVISGGHAYSDSPFYLTAVHFGDGSSEQNLAMTEGFSPSGMAQYTTSPISHRYSAAGTYSVEAWANDSAGGSATVSWVFSVATLPTVSISASNTTPILGQSIEINAVVTGGHAPYDYTYFGLPFGCNSVDLASIGCLPTQAGNFSLQVLANDSWGGSAKANMSLEVVFGFTVAAPASTIVGRQVTIGLGVPANVGAVNYTYAGLPPGCASVNAPQLTCTPNATGDFHLLITAVSSEYGPARRSIDLQVVSEAPGSPNLLGAYGQFVLAGLVGAVVIGTAIVAVRRRGRPVSGGGLAKSGSTREGGPGGYSAHGTARSEAAQSADAPDGDPWSDTF